MSENVAIERKVNTNKTASGSKIDISKIKISYINQQKVLVSNIKKLHYKGNKETTIH